MALVTNIGSVAVFDLCHCSLRDDNAAATPCSLWLQNFPWDQFVFQTEVVQIL